MAKCLATTMDNPNNPFTEFRKWLACDIEHGYNTNAFVAAFSDASDLMLEEDYEYEHEQAINRLLELNLTGIHYKVYIDDDPNITKIIYDAYMKVLHDAQ